MTVWKDTNFKVGDLVRDKLNMGTESYGLGIIVATDSSLYAQEQQFVDTGADYDPGKRYDVYFNKFERAITFHGEYLERV